MSKLEKLLVQGFTFQKNNKNSEKMVKSIPLRLGRKF